MFTLPPNAWYDAPLDNIGAIKTVRECVAITEPLLQHVVAILTADLGVDSAHPTTICERLWKPPLRMDYVQYAELIERAAVTGQIVGAFVSSKTGHYFLDEFQQHVLEHVDVTRVAASTEYIEWFKTHGVYMVAGDNEAARALRKPLFDATYTRIREQARGYPDIFNLGKTLHTGDIAIDFYNIAIGDMGPETSQVQENTVRRVLRVMQILQGDEAGVSALDVFNRMSQDVGSFEDFEANVRFIAKQFPDMFRIDENNPFGASMVRLLDLSQKRNAEEQIEVIVIESDSEAEPEEHTEEAPASVSIREVHAKFKTIIDQMFTAGTQVEAPELAQDPTVIELKRMRSTSISRSSSENEDVLSHVTRMNGMAAVLARGPLELTFKVMNKTIGLKGYAVERNSGLHDRMPNQLADAFNKPPKKLTRPGFLSGWWQYHIKYKYNLVALEAYLKAIAYVNRFYDGKRIDAEVPTLDKQVGTLNWDVRFAPQPWLSDAAAKIGFNMYLVTPSKNNPIRAGPSVFEFKRCGMTRAGIIASIKHLQEKTGGFNNIVTSERFSDLLDNPALTCMPVAWALHARLAYKAIDEKKVYFIDPWKQRIQIPADYAQEAHAKGYAVEFVQRAAEQFGGEGSCAFVSFMRMIMCSRTGKAGLTAPIEDDYAVLSYHLLSKFKQMRRCKMRHA